MAKKDKEMDMEEEVEEEAPKEEPTPEPEPEPEPVAQGKGKLVYTAHGPMIRLPDGSMTKTSD